MERKEVTRMLVGVQPQGQGTIRVVGAKLHGIVVTESKLNYHGSITIDTDILEAARLLPVSYTHLPRGGRPGEAGRHGAPHEHRQGI